MSELPLDVQFLVFGICRDIEQYFAVTRLMALR